MYYNNPITHVVKEKDNLYLIAKHYKTSVPSILSANDKLNPYNLPVGSTIRVSPGENYQPQACVANLDDTYKQNVLITNMRLAWSQHVYWTRMLLISIAERLNDLEPTAVRLLKNPADIADIYKNYYPDDAAQKIEQLLTEHLQIGAELITSLRENKTAAANSLNQQWYLNADKMANAFNAINPYYDLEKTRKMLYGHLEQTTQEVAMRLGGNYAGDIQAFNKVEDEAMMMADYLSSGILQQFPQKFY